MNRKWLRIITVIPDFKTGFADIIIERPNARSGAFVKYHYLRHKNSASFKRLERCVNKARDEGRLRLIRGRFEIADEPWSELFAKWS